jgi:pyruvate dehydrogenase E2 component (dihydrolipoamide acetyltransferase)
VAEVETDKAVMPMEAFEAGTLAVILAKEGEKVPVGGAIAVIALGKENPVDVKKKYTEKPAPAAAPAEAKKAAGQSAPPEVDGAVATMEAASAGELHEAANVGHGATREKPTAVPPMPVHGGNGGRILISPLAKRIASDTGVDLHSIKGSGPGGRIVQSDVLAASKKTEAAPVSIKSDRAAAPSQPARVAQGQKQVIPLSKMRQAIAKGLQASKQSVPHFYVMIDADVESLSAMRGRLNAQLEGEKVRLSLGDLISKAVAFALIKHPALNAHYNGEKAEITTFGDVHLGMAVALPDGLIVPVLRSVDQMGLKEIRQRSADLIDRARSQRLKQDELSGATFTISNLGTYGVREFSAIINPPSVAILAVAAAEKRPVVIDNQIVPRTMMTLTLSADHRAVDGATAADFLRTLKGLLEEPGLMLV